MDLFAKINRINEILLVTALITVVAADVKSFLQVGAVEQRLLWANGLFVVGVSWFWLLKRWELKR